MTETNIFALAQIIKAAGTDPGAVVVVPAFEKPGAE